MDTGVKDNIENALKKAKEALEGQDAQAMRTAAEQLSQASHKLAEAMYAKASRQQAGQETSGDAKEQSGNDGKKKKDDVVDADFEEVKIPNGAVTDLRYQGKAPTPDVD